MTELLSKEKEFMKMNEALNRMAGNSVHHRGHYESSTQQLMGHKSQQKAGSSFKNPPKQFSTISSKAMVSRNLNSNAKAKGPMVQNRRKAAGDGNGDLSDRRNHPYNGFANPSTIATTTTPITTVSGEPALSTTIYNNRRPIPKSNADSLYRPPTQRVRPSHITDFAIKYRNPKFVESPSLEVLVRDECSSMRCELADSTSNLTSVGDMASNSKQIVMKKGSNMGSINQKHITTDGLIKFLKSKIVILEEDHERMTQEIKQQKELLDKTLEKSRRLEQQRDQAYAKHNAVIEQLSKMETQLEDMTTKFKERTSEQLSQQKELEMVRRELKVVTQTNSNLEKRLFRATEDVESARNALLLMKNAERELKETASKESESKDKQIRSLKKQRADLLNAYKKQLFLIDNLKRQNICMEQSKMLSFSEKEFTKILEWKLNG